MKHVNINLNDIFRVNFYFILCRLGTRMKLQTAVFHSHCTTTPTTGAHYTMPTQSASAAKQNKSFEIANNLRARKKKLLREISQFRLLRDLITVALKRCSIIGTHKTQWQLKNLKC